MSRRRNSAAAQSMLFKPETIDYRCKRCGLLEKSLPLPTDPNALPVYGLPVGWELGFSLAHEGTLKLDRDDPDFCLCQSCTSDVRRGQPLDMRDLARRS